VCSSDLLAIGVEQRDEEVKIEDRGLTHCDIGSVAHI